jgi:SAM-dependent methyltransferase
MCARVGPPRASSPSVVEAVARRVRDTLRWGIAIPDADFDRLFPEPIRAMSAVHWTPVAVALRAATWLAPEPGMLVLDVGSGSGKQCCVGALARRAHWTGIEREPRLVALATTLAASLGVRDRTTFRCGDAGNVAWNDFDSLYFYNPFESVLFGSEITDLPRRWGLFGHEIDLVVARLVDLPSGTRVVTYHGFGGEMPDGFVLRSMEQVGRGQLALWIKRARRRPRYRVVRRRIGGTP